MLATHPEGDVRWASNTDVTSVASLSVEKQLKRKFLLATCIEHLVLSIMTE